MGLKKDRQVPGEWQASKLQELTTAFTSAWDERSRTFDKLRDLQLTDEARKTAIAEYKATSANFDKLRSEIAKSGGA